MKHLTKKVLSYLAVICLLAGVSGVFFMDAHAEGFRSLSNEDGTIQGIYVKISQVYGDKALAAYKKALLTGDYYEYRSITGFWGATGNDEKLMDNPDNRGCGITHPAMFYEDEAYSFMGKYATVQDYLDRLNETGYTDTSVYDNPLVSFPAVKKTLNKPTHKMLVTLPYRVLVDRVYNEGEANPYAAAAPAAATNTSAAESLKSYKGNTAEFNAYYYYVNYADLQGAFGTNGDLLKQHYNQYGKAEGRIANKLK